MAPPFCWDALLLYSNTREVKSIGKTNANILYCESIAESTDNGKKKKNFTVPLLFLASKALSLLHPEHVAYLTKENLGIF